ncbi:MAG: hypothetical protein RLZZ511_126 [Cyanobacteriota bacterium]|jgi:hypothetical protein
MKTIAALMLGLSLAVAGTATAQMAINGNQTTTLEGTSSGPVQDKACAGAIAKAANHQIKLDRATNLNFALEGANDATLLIVGSNNQRYCVQADPVSKGKVAIPGRWNSGTYDIFVGSRSATPAAYKLTIGPVSM